MQAKQFYVTSDGEAFPNFESAERHADRRYADALMTACHKLAGKPFKELPKMLDGMLDDFVTLQKLRQDCILIQDNDVDE